MAASLLHCHFYLQKWQAVRFKKKCKFPLFKCCHMNVEFMRKNRHLIVDHEMALRMPTQTYDFLWETIKAT
jgi:hypothetical protein